MNVLVTAGNTQILIDRVRCLTNIFTGRTGARIAIHAQRGGHTVTLLTSHPATVAELGGDPAAISICPYQTFDELHRLMEGAIAPGTYDAVIHSAAVSDYLSAGVYSPGPDTRFDLETATWTGSPASLVDQSAGKVKSSAEELWLRLVRAPKLVDRIRTEWGFRGVLVKFKLEVGVSEQWLLEIAEPSRVQSEADLMVANTLEGAAEWALLGPFDGRYERIARGELETRLLHEVERLHREKNHG